MPKIWLILLFPVIKITGNSIEAGPKGVGPSERPTKQTGYSTVLLAEARLYRPNRLIRLADKSQRSVL